MQWDGVDLASVAGTGPVDWSTYRRGGGAYAFVRATWGTRADKAFPGYWSGLLAAGVTRGAYLFWRAAQDPAAQASAFARQVGTLGRRDFPPILDLEFPGGRKALGMSAGEALGRFIATWEAVRAIYGVAPMIYTSGRVWREDLDDPPTLALIDSALWLARYAPTDPSVPRPWGAGNWWFHQFAGNVQATKIPGFHRGQVDLNRFRPAAMGERSARVEWLQLRAGTKADGIFGPNTAAAVRKFQADQGLKESGIVDVETFARLAWVPPEV